MVRRSVLFDVDDIQRLYLSIETAYGLPRRNTSPRLLGRPVIGLSERLTLPDKSQNDPA